MKQRFTIRTNLNSDYQDFDRDPNVPEMGIVYPCALADNIPQRMELSERAMSADLAGQSPAFSLFQNYYNAYQFNDF